MELPAFALKDWLESQPSIRYNLAGSTGPLWRYDALLALGGERLDPGEVALAYGPMAGGSALRAEIAKFHAVDPDWVVVTNGASEAIFLVLLALARPQGRVALPCPAYPAFAAAAQILSLGVDRYALRPGDGFVPDPDRVMEAVGTDTVAVLANTPHNPTGAVLPRESCAGLAASLGALGVPLLVDEVFHPIYFGNLQTSAAAIENVIVVGDMSKALSLPGLRIGWIIDANADRRCGFIRARSHLSLGSSPLLETLALHALRHREAIVEDVYRAASRNLAELRLFMASVRDTLDWIAPAAGLVAFPWFRDGRDSRPFCERLIASDVLVVPGDCFGMPEHLRIEFGSQRDGIAPALDLIQQELRRI